MKEYHCSDDDNKCLPVDQSNVQEREAREKEVSASSNEVANALMFLNDTANLHLKDQSRQVSSEIDQKATYINANDKTASDEELGQTDTGSLCHKPTGSASTSPTSNELAATNDYETKEQSPTLGIHSNYNNGSQIITHREKINNKANDINTVVVVTSSDNDMGNGDDYDSSHDKLHSELGCNNNNKHSNDKATSDIHYDSCHLVADSLISQREEKESKLKNEKESYQPLDDLSTCNIEIDVTTISATKGSLNETFQPSTASSCILKEQEEKSLPQSIKQINSLLLSKDANEKTRLQHNQTFNNNNNSDCNNFGISTKIPCPCQNSDDTTARNTKSATINNESQLPMKESSKNINNLPSLSRKLNNGNMKLHLQYKKNDYKKRINEIKHSAMAVQKLKVELYMESIVHNGHDSERKFAEYWNAFGQYVSAPYSLPTKQYHRSNCDVNMNGIEAILNQFLVTKSLRKKHNQLIRAIMKQCMHNQVLESRVLCHTPQRWKKKIHKVHRLNHVNNEHSASANARGELAIPQSLHVDNLLQFNYDDKSLNKQQDVNKESTPQIILSNDSNQTVNHKSSEFVIEKFDDSTNHQINTESCRLPGMIEIDYLSRAALKTTDYTLSQNGLWLITAGVRDYIARFLQHAAEAAIERENLGVNDLKLTRKRSRITSFDIITALDSLDSDSTKFSTRNTWERCISEVDHNLPFGVNMRNNISSMDEITNLIMTASSKKPKVEDVAPKRASVGKGKDLAAMVVRHQLTKASTPDLSNFSRDSISLPTRNGDAHSRPPSIVNLQEVNRSSSCNLNNEVVSRRSSISKSITPNSNLVNAISLSPFSNHGSAMSNSNTQDSTFAGIAARRKNDDETFKVTGQS